MNVAIILPSLNRPAKLKRNLGNMLMQMLPAGVDRLIVSLAIQRTDVQTLTVANDLAVLWADSDTDIIVAMRDSGTTCVQGFNIGYAAIKGLADWYVLSSDDQVYQPGWLAEALKVADETGAQVIGFNDGHTDIAHYAPHYMMHKDFIADHMGGQFVPPEYQTWWFDREVCEKAQAVGLYAPAWAAHVEHQHPDWGTAEIDDTHREAMPGRAADKLLYEQRRAVQYA